nr:MULTISPECIES: DUF523 domain-containing protein [unclassified Halomonas]
MAFLPRKPTQDVAHVEFVLKEHSSSCGSAWIHDGHFNGKSLAGSGVTAALLQRHGIQVISERQLADLLL